MLTTETSQVCEKQIILGPDTNEIKKKEIY